MTDKIKKIEAEGNALVVRSEVPKLKNYSDYRQYLRYDFWFSCAYCSITEFEAWGIRFEIDHYFPQRFRELRNKYVNLFYSCEKCNEKKGDLFPDENYIENGYWIIRVDEEDPRDHIEIMESDKDNIKNSSDLDEYKLVSKTPTGEFNIQVLDLNREILLRIRKYRKRLYDSTRYLAHGISELRAISLDRVNKRNRLVFDKIKKNIIDRGESFLHM